MGFTLTAARAASRRIASMRRTTGLTSCSDEPEPVAGTQSTVRFTVGWRRVAGLAGAFHEASEVRRFHHTQWLTVSRRIPSVCRRANTETRVCAWPARTRWRVPLGRAHFIIRAKQMRRDIPLYLIKTNIWMVRLDNAKQQAREQSGIWVRPDQLPFLRVDLPTRQSA